jgi:hypothetical protein
MSFSTGLIRGTAAAVRAALAARQEEQKTIDAGWNAPQSVVDGHQAEFEVAKAALEKAIESAGEENRTFSITVAGHSNEHGSSQPTISLGWWPEVSERVPEGDGVQQADGATAG